MNLPDSAILNNLYMPGFTRPDTCFEKKYIACRSKEKRMYPDEEVRDLPGCAPSNIHYKEWMIRKASADRLCSYLQNKKRPLNILEVGCGNGWLSHRLSDVSRAKIMGLDINFTELQQAARVFNNCHKIKFMYGDLRSGILKDREFDIILFAASIQYFPSLDEILELSLEHLGPLGEIHITDTKFYPLKEVTAAKKRSVAYYSTLGLPEMADHYFHHSMQALAPFNHTVLYNPFSFLNRLGRNMMPFHWIRINKDQS